MIFFSCRNKKIWLVNLLFIFSSIKNNELSLNNADSYRMYAAPSLLRDIDVGQTKNPDHKDKCDCNRDFFKINIFPFFQYASSGTDIDGNDTLTYYDFSNLDLMATSNASSIASSANTSGAFNSNSNGSSSSAGLVYTVPMPLGAIPQRFNFFGLFYPWSKSDSREEWDFGPAINISDETTKNKILTSGKTEGNIVSKIIARYLGYETIPYKFDVNAEKPITSAFESDPLKYNYQNYRNVYFGSLSNQKSRDPSKIFGYGYFDMRYKKYGLRGSIEIYPFVEDNFQIKFKTGYAHLDVDSVNIIDTTINSQGPTAALMYAKYDSDINIGNTPTNNFPGTPNIYQMNHYGQEIIGEPIFNELYNSIGQSGKADKFKTLYMQNIQNNINGVGEILNQNFKEFHDRGMEDLTCEFFYKHPIYIKNSYSKNEDIFSSFYSIPYMSFSVSMPTSPEVEANKIFAKPIGNNGHWAYNTKCGLVFDFTSYLAFNFDFGFSFYNSKSYTNVPVPTKELEEGIFTYSADINKDPGNTYSLGLGLQSDLFLNSLSFWGEYRFIHHSKDSIILNKVLPLLKIKNIYRLDDVPNFSITSPITVENGILYTSASDPKDLPYPTKILNNKMESLSLYTIHMANFSLKWNITPYSSLNFILQQPFSMINAFNTTTIGISMEIIF